MVGAVWIEQDKPMCGAKKQCLYRHWAEADVREQTAKAFEQKKAYKRPGVEDLNLRVRLQRFTDLDPESVVFPEEIDYLRRVAREVAHETASDFCGAARERTRILEAKGAELEVGGR